MTITPLKLPSLRAMQRWLRRHPNLFEESEIAALTDSDSYEVRLPRGFSARLYIGQDDSSEAPWENDDLGRFLEDGDRHERKKRPGQIVLGGHYRHESRLFDMQAATAFMVAEYEKCEATYGHGSQWTAHRPIGLTLKERVKADIEATLDRWRRWMNNDWCYVGVTVRIAYHGVPLDDNALWGVESDCTDYMSNVAHENAGEALALSYDRLGPSFLVPHPARNDVRVAIVQDGPKLLRLSLHWWSGTILGWQPHDEFRDDDESCSGEATDLFEAIATAHALMREYDDMVAVEHDTIMRLSA